MKEKHKQKSILAIIALSVVPLIICAKLPSAWTARSAFLYFSAITGFVGALILIWSYILGTRSVTGNILKDQAWVLRIHKFLGIYGTLLIFLHPLLIVYGYGESLLYIFLPHLQTGFERSVSWGRLSFAVLLLTWVTSALVRGKIGYRPWKYIHYLSYIALPAVLLHSPHVGTTLGNSKFALYYWYFIVITFLVFTCLRLRHIFGYGKDTYVIVENRLITDDSGMMRLKNVGRAMKVAPGQYVYVQPSLWSEEHPFSVMDFDNQSGEIAISYRTVGSFTKKLAAMEPGQRILADGPYGVFTSEIATSSPRPTVFIAGGIGITPFIWHLRNMRDSDVFLLYCNRTKTSGVYSTYLKSILSGRYIDIISDENSAVSSPQTEAGYLSREIVSKYITDPTRYEYYICGPKAMMKNSVTILSDLGVSKDNLHTEEFSF